MEAFFVPQLLWIGSYIIYFWSNEGRPLEPVYVHVAEGRASANATKLWISSVGKVMVCNNNSNIPNKVLGRISRVVEANSEEIIAQWYDHFGEVHYYC